MIRTAVGPVARARNGVIGRKGALPWTLRSDLKLFKAATLGKPLIMGRKTWESLPRRPLPGRLNLVLSRDESFSPYGAIVCDGLEEALEIGREHAAEEGVDEVCVIGGAAVLTQALPRARRLYLTQVEADVEGDVVWPLPDLSSWTEVRSERFAAGEGDDFAFAFKVYERT